MGRTRVGAKEPLMGSRLHWVTPLLPAVASRYDPVSRRLMSASSGSTFQCCATRLIRPIAHRKHLSPFHRISLRALGTDLVLLEKQCSHCTHTPNTQRYQPINCKFGAHSCNCRTYVDRSQTIMLLSPFAPQVTSNCCKLKIIEILRIQP